MPSTAERKYLPDNPFAPKFMNGDVILRSIVLGVAASFAGVAALDQAANESGVEL